MLARNSNIYLCVQRAMVHGFANEFKSFKKNKERSPNFEKLYRAFLNISPTSVASERAFSAAGRFITNERSRMSHQTLDDLCFLKSYFKNKMIKNAKKT